MFNSLEQSADENFLADELDIPDESSAYMEFLNNEASARGVLSANWDDEDDDLEEETLLETPLDNIEPYQLFRNALLGMYILSSKLSDLFFANRFIELQQQQPQIYEGLTKGLSPDEQNVIKGVVHEAEAKKLAADAMAAAVGGMPVNGHQ
jgi:hypothetical protein